VREALAGGLVAFAAFLPFLRGALSGSSLYFRDLSLYFLPMRRFALEGLGRGEVRLWNPFVHEGVPLSLPALGYPIDLLQLLRPDAVGISLVLALHVPLAAVAFFALARGLGLPRLAAAGGGLVYAVGGFLLSSVNLYVYVEAAAWAPLLVLGLVRILAGAGARGLSATAAVLALALSTTGAEIVVQALLVGLVLGAVGRSGHSLRALARAALAVALGTALAAPVLALVGGQFTGSARGRGFGTDVVLAHSVHPFTLVQTVVGGLYGNLYDLADQWWGQNFFPRGFPYVLSLYVGAAAVSLAATGALSGHPLRRRLAALLAMAVVLSLGRWAGLAPIVDALPLLHLVRFPVKAFFTAHVALSLLVALAVAALAQEKDGRAWRRLAVGACGLGAVLAIAPLMPRALPGPSAGFAAAFFPPGYEAGRRALLLGRVLDDAAAGGAVALAVAAVAACALFRVLPRPRAALLVVALIGADLLRCGAGLNPTVSGAFFRPSPELEERLDSFRQGRVFTCAVEESPSYLAARAARTANHEVWSFGVLLETLTPAFNTPLAVPTALSPDLTMLVPEDRVLSADACRDLDALVPRLRGASVHAVLSMDPLSHPDLEPDGTLRPERISPLVAHVYRLRRPLERFFVASQVAAAADPSDAATPVPAPDRPATGGVTVQGGFSVHDARGSLLDVAVGADRLAFVVEADRPTVLVVRDGWDPGWRAWVEGSPAQVLRADGPHRAVPVPAGRSHVTMRFAPRALAPSLAVSAFAAGALLVLARPRSRR
jgi:hypothetical protein